MSLVNLYSNKETPSAEFLGSDRGTFRSKPETCQPAVPTPGSREQGAEENRVVYSECMILMNVIPAGL